MSNEAVLKEGKEIEALLRQCGAVGRGIHSMVSDIEHRLTASLVRKLRLVGSVRNRIAHELGSEYDKDMLERFFRVAGEAKEELKECIEPTRQSAYSGSSSSSYGGWTAYQASGSSSSGGSSRMDDDLYLLELALEQWDKMSTTGKVVTATTVAAVAAGLAWAIFQD